MGSRLPHSQGILLEAHPLQDRGAELEEFAEQFLGISVLLGQGALEIGEGVALDSASWQPVDGVQLQQQPAKEGHKRAAGAKEQQRPPKGERVPTPMPHLEM